MDGILVAHLHVWDAEVLRDVFVQVLVEEEFLHVHVAFEGFEGCEWVSV